MEHLQENAAKEICGTSGTWNHFASISGWHVPDDAGGCMHGVRTCS